MELHVSEVPPDVDIWRVRLDELLAKARALLDQGAPIPFEEKRPTLPIRQAATLWYYPSPFEYRQQESKDHCVRDVVEIIGRSLYTDFLHYGIRLTAWKCDGALDPRLLAERMLVSFRAITEDGR